MVPGNFREVHNVLFEELISEPKPGGSEVVSRGRSCKAKSTAHAKVLRQDKAWRVVMHREEACEAGAE